MVNVSEYPVSGHVPVIRRPELRRFRDTASRVLVRLLIAAVCSALPGCHAAHKRHRVHQPWNRTISQSAIVEQSSVVNAATEPAAVETESGVPQTPAAVPPENSPSNPAASTPDEQPTLSEDAVSDLFRSAGGKLRPDDDGRIVEIDLSFSSITDTQFAAIAAFPELAELDLTGTELHDEAIPVLVGLKSLKALKLKGTKITNAGLQQLSAVSTLILLDASSTAVDDDGLRSAAGWRNLRYLSLNNTGVSDAGLQALAVLSDLKGLSVINTSVTETGVIALKKQLPDCLIVAKTGQSVGKVDAVEDIPRLPDLNPLNASTGIASEEQLRQVTQLASLQPHLAVHLSRIYSSREQWAETAEILATAAAAAPGEPTIHFALGQALGRLGRTEEAVSQFEHCVSPAEARYLAGVIVYESSLKTAEQYFAEVVAADPKLQAARIRRDRIQQELAALRERPRTAAASRNEALEIIPAVSKPPIRSASQSRVVPQSSTP